METRKYVISARLFLLPNRTIWACYALPVNALSSSTKIKHRADITDFTIPAGPNIFCTSDIHSYFFPSSWKPKYGLLEISQAEKFILKGNRKYVKKITSW